MKILLVVILYKVAATLPYIIQLLCELTMHMPHFSWNKYYHFQTGYPGQLELDTVYPPTVKVDTVNRLKFKLDSN
jgi:hypothetical protein